MMKNFKQNIYRVWIMVLLSQVQTFAESWTSKADFGGAERNFAVGFSIGSKGYIGTGYDGISITKDFWEYDPSTNVWTQKADFGGTARQFAAGFSTDSKGYIGTGYDNSGYTKDFWEYDPSTNAWTRKNDFGGTARYQAVGFSIGSKGYIGTGYNNDGYKNDFWEFDPSNNTWVQKNNFGGTARSSCVGFSIGSKGYIGIGYDGFNNKNDFWEFDPVNNSWAQKANFGGTARAYAVGFSIGSKGYIGTGYDGANRMSDFWTYDQYSNTWKQKTDFGGSIRAGATGFSIGSKGYMGLGGDGFYRFDFWEYDPTPKISQMEYFIDNDPGYGSGTTVSFTPATSVTVNFPVSITSTADGFHFLSLRAKDDNNGWGMVAVRPFYKETIPTASLPNITAMEYFLDADPGYGSGTAVSFTAGTNPTQSFTIPLPGTVADGFHFLSLRAKDANNKWSVVGVRPFYKETIPTASLPSITAMEYFLDVDPGYGSGTTVSFTAGTNPTQSFTIPLPGTVADGFHYLSLRAKDTNNKWSVVAIRPFYKETLPTGGLPNITAMEYFIDNDPGYGSGTAVSFTPGTNPTQSFTIGLGSQSSGAHKLFIRAKDVNNKWSIVGIKDFVVSNQFVIASSSSTASWCQSTPFTITYTAAGTYNAGNVFTAQLSDASGSFSSPTVLGTVTATSSGTITATIPSSIPVGSSYQLRIVSSNPSVADTPSISFAIIATCPSPCPASLVLQSPPATPPAEGIDYSALPAVVRQAAAANGSIVATNKITGSAKVTYEAGTVTLNPGFKSESGTIFIAQIGGCN